MRHEARGDAPEGQSKAGADEADGPQGAEGSSAEAHPSAGEAPADRRPGSDSEAGSDPRASESGPARGDTVAAVVRQWRAVHPGLDTGPMEVIGRINRCAALLQQAEDAPLRRAGLSRPEFDLLGALRRTGHELTPGDLARETFSSGAAVTKRLKHLTERGLVERRGDTRDRRVAHLRLTDAGRDLVDGILPDQLSYETAVLSVLAPEGQGELAALLADLLSGLEGRMGALRA
ncbi:MarR family winged helix-turn-helix transcriptional regulator [Streptomyces diastatochromogenes]